MSNSDVNILIVDDNLKNIQLLGNVLKEERYSVYYACLPSAKLGQLIV